MSAPFRVMIVLGSVLALLTPAGGFASQTPRQDNPDTLPIRRIPATELRIPDAGWALISRWDYWEKLWRDYGQERHASDGTLLVPAAPAVDFKRFQVLAVSFGPRSGCGGPVDLVRSIVDEGVQRTVVLSPDQDYGPCDMMLEPLDLVLLARSSKPICLRLQTRLTGTRWTLPPPASWWVPLSVAAALDTGVTPSQRRAHGLSRRVLPRDQSLPIKDYRQLAAAAYASHDWEILERLRRNSRAMTDKVVLAWLASDRRISDVRQVRLDFLDRFGLAVATDRRAARPWLEALLEVMTYHETVGPDGQPRYRDVALALVENTKLLEDSVLAGRLTYAVQWYPDAQILACRAYLDRYPKTLVLTRDSTGAPRTMLTAYCPANREGSVRGAT
jgi:hypothetical protein